MSSPVGYTPTVWSRMKILECFRDISLLSVSAEWSEPQGRLKAITSAQRYPTYGHVSLNTPYDCICLLPALSNQQKWDEPYNDFDLHAFYWNIVELLSTGAEGDMAVAYLNEQVFGKVIPEHARMSDAKRLLAQRAHAV
ncbi:hypothetical protein QCA50_018066 [Cerrena zonata]|uniref:Uncharacterized protein n=1 Tax=Cerrena zonata TaxID=2478898 RepID=A0AAW0FE04_9APHY